eukprot:TsM_000347100 transcript=TsM_000347100 gene=TsM_000347100
MMDLCEFRSNSHSAGASNLGSLSTPAFIQLATFPTVVTVELEDSVEWEVSSRNLPASFWKLVAVVKVQSQTKRAKHEKKQDLNPRKEIPIDSMTIILTTRPSRHTRYPPLYTKINTQVLSY